MFPSIIMTLTPEFKKHLLHFSAFQAKQPSTRLDTLSPLERMTIVQKEWLEGDGLNVIPSLKTHLQKSIDASTGSSAFVPPDGLEKDIKNVRSEQLPEYNNHLPQKDLVLLAQNYFQEIEILPSSVSLQQDVYGEAKPNDYFCVIGHGTTHLFTSALKSLIKTKGDVIIITEPTYGLFLKPILNENGAIEALPLNAENKYKPDAKELVQLIQTTNAKLLEKYFKQTNMALILLNGYFAENPITPAEKKVLLKCFNQINALNKAKEPLTFESLDKAVADFNQALLAYLNKKHAPEEATYWHDKLKLPLCPRVRGYFHINPHMPLGTICDQEDVNKLANALKPFSDVTVIDDLTYYDLLTPPSKVTPGTFAKSALKGTLTLYSLSKQYALANIRPGIALGPQALIKPICEDLFNSNNTPNVVTIEAFYSTFKMGKKQRAAYLKETNDEYAYRRDFTIALTLGIKHIKDKKQVKRIKKELSDLKVSSVKQEKCLEGITGLTLSVIPDSGFFLLMDFSHYQGRYLGTAQLNQSRDFRNAFYCLADVNTIPGELMHQFDKPVLRFSYSMTPAEILEGISRIKGVLELSRALPLTVDESKKVTNNGLPIVTIKRGTEPKKVSRLFVPAFETKRIPAVTTISVKVLPTTSFRTEKKGKRKLVPTRTLDM